MTGRERLRRAWDGRAARMAVLALLCLLAAAVAGLGGLGSDWTFWVQDWIGRLFRALSGALLGFYLSRLLARLRFSEIPTDQRGQSAIAQALWVAGLAIGVAS